MPAGSNPTVGVIGLGAIGAGVAGALASSDMALVVCDIRSEATKPFEGKAHVAADLHDVGARCDVVLVAVVDDQQLRSVLEAPGGALATMKAGGSVVVLSTVSVPTLLAVAQTASQVGVSVVDCGVTGGPVAASSGDLASMLGGSDEAVDAVRPVVDTFSSLVEHMGPLGAGMQAKLARNVVQYGAWLAAYEGQKLAEAAGIELAKLANVIRTSEQHTGGTTRLMFRPTVAPFTPDDPEFVVDAMRAGATLAHKDLKAALSMAESLGVDAPLARLTEASADAMFGMSEERS